MVMPGSSVARTPGASVMRALGVAVGWTVGLGVGLTTSGWSGAAGFFGCASVYAPDPMNASAVTAIASARAPTATP